MRNNQGVTLIELIIVVVIIGVLATVAQPKLAGAISKTRASEFPTVLHKLKTAEEVYFTEQSSFYLGILRTSDNTLQNALGIPINSTYFDFTLFPVAFDNIANVANAGTNGYGTGYIVGATVKKTIGIWAVDATIWYDSDGFKYAVPEEPVYAYANGWVKGSNLGSLLD